MKKLVSILMAIMMIAVCAIAIADDDNVYSGSNDNLATGVAGTTSIPLNKTLVIFNTNDSTSVREPAITFSYTLSKVDSIADEGAQLTYTVTDGTNTVKVYNGVMAGVTNPASITFAQNNTVAATTKGYEDEKPTSITVTPTAFPHAGIYRYKITESSDPADVTTRGLEAHTSNYDNTRYLDIYIYNPDANHTTQWMGAAVIFKSVATSPAAPGSDNINTTFEKTTGFEPGNDGTPGTTDFTDDETVDRYFTYNLDVTKAITGTLADKGHDFPFQISLTGALANAVTVDINNNGTASTGSVSTTVLSQTAALSDGDTYSVKGLPKGTTVTVTEYNDTVDVYKLTTTLTGTTSTSSQNNAAEGTTLATVTGETGVLINSGDATNVKADTKTVLTFTNDLQTISPTGYVSRFAPYALILIGGVALLIVAKKRKPAKDDEE